MRFLSALLAAGAVTLAPGVTHAGETPKSHRAFRAEAQSAYARKNYTAAREAITAALELRPDSPRYLHNLAALSALTGDPETAIDALRSLAALGVATAIERDADLASLQGSPAFQQVLQAFADNREPKGSADIIAELPGRTGIIEGIAFRPRTGDLFLGDVHHRCIWRRDRAGQVNRFSADDEELFGIFGIAIDEARNTLWAGMAALPEMSGYTPEMKGLAALAEFDLGTSELRRIVPVPGDGRDHGLGDVLVAPDGTVYASDSLAPVVWQLSPGEEELEKVVDSPEFGSLQGMVLSKRTLLVADYENGLFRIDIDRGEFEPLRAPRNTTLVGLDGLVAAPNGIVAIQNGTTPQRVLHLAMPAEFGQVIAVTVLASALPELTDLALVTLVNDHPTFIAGAGWDGFDPVKAKQPAARTVRIFQVQAP